MARTQRNKATMGHLGLLKARLAKLRRELITPKGGGGGPGEGFDVAKTGDARIGFVGFPSVGKSTLMNTLAGVFSEVAAYEFTTLTTVPGVIKYKGAKIQLLDLPGIIEGAKDGKGRGRQVIAVARTCSLIFIVLDVLKPLQHKRILEREVEGFGIRLNKEPPAITLRRKDKGGINLQMLVPQSELDMDTVKTILSEYKIHNADITLRCDASSDDLIDVIEGNRIYIPCIYVLNKIDQISVEELDIIYKIPHCVPISAHHKWNFDDLLEKAWSYLKLIRIALVWGSSVKHNPQKVGKEHVLNDEDVVQVVKRNSKLRYMDTVLSMARLFCANAGIPAKCLELIHSVPKEGRLLRRNRRDLRQTAEPFNEQETSLVRFSSESSATTECSPESSSTLSRAPSGSSETPLLVPAENSETSMRVTGEGCDTSGGLPFEHNDASCRREEMTPATLSAQPQSPEEQAVCGPSSPIVRRSTREKRQPCRLNYDEQFQQTN
ncbi:hypothetical protein HPB51_005474 [Rhipicephalus microplus]|uniref:OBG-type G domain-containing protein n=1 Tax=Rhipicephalus microplus TaxID=6941 RepID=A0A9J6EYN3_RHIMP|nr:hypothetical protein HPB51_005474 [Rhipicephalus microplus]